MLRKILLDLTRIQIPVHLSITLSANLQKLRPELLYLGIPRKKYLTLVQCGHLDYIISSVDKFHGNPILCRLLSYFARAERTRFPEENLLQGRKTVDKEFWLRNFRIGLNNWPTTDLLQSSPPISIGRYSVSPKGLRISGKTHICTQIQIFGTIFLIYPL